MTHSRSADIISPFCIVVLLHDAPPHSLERTKQNFTKNHLHRSPLSVYYKSITPFSQSIGTHAFRIYEAYQQSTTSIGASAPHGGGCSSEMRMRNEKERTLHRSPRKYTNGPHGQHRRLRSPSRSLRAERGHRAPGSREFHDPFTRSDERGAAAV